MHDTMARSAIYMSQGTKCRARVYLRLGRSITTLASRIGNIELSLLYIISNTGAQFKQEVASRLDWTETQ